MPFVTDDGGDYLQQQGLKEPEKARREYLRLDLSVSDGVPPLTSLRELRLPVAYPALTHLDVSNNGLSSLEGVGELYSLQTLLATHNFLEQPPDLLEVRGLVKLDLSHNVITSASEFPSCLCFDSLEYLSLSGNEVQHLCEAKSLAVFSALTSLDLEGNAAVVEAEGMRIDLTPLFLFLLPNLTRLNGKRVMEGRRRNEYAEKHAPGALTDNAVQKAGVLFRSPNGQLSPALLDLLEPPLHRHLLGYLRKTCPLPPTSCASPTPPMESHGAVQYHQREMAEGQGQGLRRPRWTEGQVPQGLPEHTTTAPPSSSSSRREESSSLCCSGVALLLTGLSPEEKLSATWAVEQLQGAVRGARVRQRLKGPRRRIDAAVRIQALYRRYSVQTRRKKDRTLRRSSHVGAAEGGRAQADLGERVARLEVALQQSEMKQEALSQALSCVLQEAASLRERVAKLEEKG